MTTLARVDILEAARLFPLRSAIVDRFAARFPDVEVRAHPGRLDMGDVLEKGVFAAPSIAIAVNRARPDPRLSQADDLVAEITAYVVCEDMMIAGRRVERDEFALALCEAMLKALADNDFTHFVDDLSDVDDAKAEPVFTMKTFEHGTVYYAVTWKQTLCAVADPAFATELS